MAEISPVSIKSNLDIFIHHISKSRLSQGTLQNPESESPESYPQASVSGHPPFNRKNLWLESGLLWPDGMDEEGGEREIRQKEEGRRHINHTCKYSKYSEDAERVSGARRGRHLLQFNNADKQAITNTGSQWRDQRCGNRHQKISDITEGHGIAFTSMHDLTWPAPADVIISWIIKRGCCCTTVDAPERITEGANQRSPARYCS